MLNRDTAWHPKVPHIPFEEPDKTFQNVIEHLYNISGFPEPASIGWMYSISIPFFRAVVHIEDLTGNHPEKVLFLA